MFSELKGKTVNAKLWLPVESVESSALTQLRNIASLPWVAHVAVMPDCHFGMGATVGSVIAMRGAVAPAAVGVDIGCGMGAIRTSLRAEHLPDDLRQLRSTIEARIPVGFSGRPESFHGQGKLKQEISELIGEFKNLTPTVAESDDRYSRATHQLGTLGGGNHFVELCLDTADAVWMMLHSGSRNVGKTLAEVHIARARQLVHNVKLPDRDLAVFLAGTPEMQEYRRDLYWAQRYALLNRRAMFEEYKAAMRDHFPDVAFEEPILCHHNYVAEEEHFGEQLFVTRKGAISARVGQLGIIPGSMGTRSFIVRGRGNPDALASASHGAGRRMSRSQAKKRFTRQDLVTQTEGVECRKDDGVIDEIPGAYKPIEEVMANQADLVEVVAELKQVLCIKG